VAEAPSDEGPKAQEPLVLDDERSVWLTALYEANVRMVLSTCRRLLRSPEDAADAAHEVFLRAAASLQAAPDGKEARAWLTTVARNYCLDLLRRRQRLQSALTALGAGVAPLESETQVVDRQLAQAVFEQLAVRERRALWESHVEERPLGEIVQRLRLSYPATARLLHRARRRAAFLAAELAAILAVVRSGLLRRRTVVQNTVQPVGAVLAIPLVMTALISTGSGTPSAYAAHAWVAGAVQQSVRRPHVEAKPVQAAPAAQASLPPPAANLVAIVLPPPTSAKVQPTVGVLAVTARPSPPPRRLSPPYKWGHFKPHPPGKAVGHGR
jgi:RNA polymerase sigma-70 factor (ECF subfamily)